MTATDTLPHASQDHGKRVEAAIATNVRVYLGLSGKSQKALGDALGITKGAVSQKMVGRTGWSVTDLITAADFLGVTPAALMDDTILSKAESGYAPAPARVGALVGAGSPRFLSVPSTPTPRSRVESQVQLKVLGRFRAVRGPVRLGFPVQPLEA